MGEISTYSFARVVRAVKETRDQDRVSKFATGEAEYALTQRDPELTPRSRAYRAIRTLNISKNSEVWQGDKLIKVYGKGLPR